MKLYIEIPDTIYADFRQAALERGYAFRKNLVNRQVYAESLKLMTWWLTGGEDDYNAYKEHFENCVKAKLKPEEFIVFNQETKKVEIYNKVTSEISEFKTEG